MRGRGAGGRGTGSGGVSRCGTFGDKPPDPQAQRDHENTNDHKQNRPRRPSAAGRLWGLYVPGLSVGLLISRLPIRLGLLGISLLCLLGICVLGVALL